MESYFFKGGRNVGGYKPSLLKYEGERHLGEMRILWKHNDDLRVTDVRLNVRKSTLIKAP